MKILSAEQIRKVDRLTIAQEPIASIDLMERAALAFTEWFTGWFAPRFNICIICGSGNNGGDGLAVGRMLTQKNYKADVYAIGKSEHASEDFKLNETRLSQVSELRFITGPEAIPKLEDYDIIVDALFGSGLSRPVEGLHAVVIKAINAAQKTVISIDIASGLFADKHSRSGAIVEATHTVSFQMPKLAFFMPENERYVGEWHVVDIGLKKEAIDAQQSAMAMLTKETIRQLVMPRKKFSHKGTYGKALIMAGSYGKMGAAVLCARAALRSGLGLLTMNIPACGYDIIQTAAPEAMALVDEGDHYLTSYPDVSLYDAVGVGPGIGRAQETMYSLMQTIQNFNKPVVIDADGLNIISEHREILELLPPNSILTPHVREFERLTGSWSNDFERLEMQKSFSREYKVITVLKGAHTAITLPEGLVYFNSTGNPGMATGGTGDVLTGILVALMAQKYSPRDAVRIGIYIHGLAGDLAAGAKGQVGIIASDLIDFLAESYRQL